MTYVFADFNALHFVLAGGVVPDDVVAGPVTTWRNADGGIHVSPQSPLPASAQHILDTIGVKTITSDVPAFANTCCNWLQLFPVARDHVMPHIDSQTPILFEFSSHSALTRLINELLRQGHDRSGVRQFSDRYFVRVIGPPYYSVLAALDDHDRLATAYREAAPGVWVQLAHNHPMADCVDVPTGKMLLLRTGHDWEMITDRPFQDIAELLEIAVPLIEASSVEKWQSLLTVPLKPAPSASTESASLWVLRQHSIAQMDRFVQGADFKVLSQLSFAETESAGTPIVVLRLRPTRLPPPDVSLVAESYRPWLRLPNLFVPLATRVDPPLRRDAIQTLMADDPAVITWLSCHDGEFLADSLADDAFQPLLTWIDGVLDRSRVSLTEWCEATEFGFAGIFVEEPAAPATKPTAKPRATKNAVKAEATRPLPPKSTRPQRRPAPIRESQRIELPTNTSELRERLTAVENEFLAIDGPLDDPRRQELWPRLAELNAALRQPAEATLAWSHAIWEDEPISADDSSAWVRAENPMFQISNAEDEIGRLLAISSVTVGDARSLAAIIVWLSTRHMPTALNRLADIQAYLAANERLLPVRATWLVWCACTTLAGGDTLTLVRARDRLLARLLDRGLDADADLPTFLRFAGRTDSDRLRSVREWIDEIRTQVRKWYGEQFSGDIRRDPTAAYIDLFFAFGLARLGEASAARALVKHSEAILEDVSDDTRDAHLVLLQALNWRVEQLLAGRPHAGPLPAEVLDYLAQMHAETSPLPRTSEYNKRRTGPYAVERFREQSRIMEPLEKFDPYRHTRREGHDLVRDAAKLPDLRDPAGLAIRINQLLRPTEGVPELRIRVLAECVPMSGRLSFDAASTLLDRAAQTLASSNITNDGPALEVRLRLIERSLFFAAHFDRSDLVPMFVDHLVRLFELDSATVALEGSGYAMGQTLRSLRKLGFRDETIRILTRLESALLRGKSIDALAANPPRNWPAIQQALLHVAAGWIYLDDAKRAAPVLETARQLLLQKSRNGADEVSRPQYVQILCNLISAYGYLPPSEARARISDLFASGQLGRLPNTFTTSSFYSRFHLNVAEAVVLTLSGEDFTLGPAARRWLDEDEYLIRRRVHRDVRRALERG